MLSNFSAEDSDDDEVEEFIKILPINRFAILVIDSDKRNEDAKINSSKTRLQAELKKSGGVVWVTAGKEIENYVPYEIRKTAVASVHKSSIGLAKSEAEENQWDHPISYKRSGDKTIDEGMNKIKIAQQVALAEPDFSILDLKERIDEVVAFIKRANRIQ